MQLGFVLDQSRCIGCHACTVACKSENNVPVGRFRTWVKYTENGTFPEVKRNFTVLRCNQCTDAPCVTICPVTALHKRQDGIVDIDHRVCIGCKSCMQACPYDALYINDSSGTAQKCHFCAHRTELGLAPACAVVCPTEAIIPGDFHDPESRVAQLRAGNELSVRKPEAGTGPNVFYKQADVSGIDPLRANASGGLLWANQIAGMQLDAQAWEALQEQAQARTVYDVAHPPLWGGKVSSYLFSKSLAAGIFLAGGLALPPFSSGMAGRGVLWLASLALLLLGITTALLIGDLKRPERFLLILRRPNWSSWLARGSVVLIAYGVALAIWFAFGLAHAGAPVSHGDPVSWSLSALTLVTMVIAGLTACYTAWLFAQSRGRVLWMKRGLWLHLLAQAFVAGGALLLLLAPVIGIGGEALAMLRRVTLVALVMHFGMTVVEGRLAPAKRENEYHRTVRLLTHGPFATNHWAFGVLLGTLLPMVLLLAFMPTALQVLGALLALVGLYIEEDLLVRAGQALPIS